MKKSYTTWDVKNPVHIEMNYQTQVVIAGFLVAINSNPLTTAGTFSVDDFFSHWGDMLVSWRVYLGDPELKARGFPTLKAQLKSWHPGKLFGRSQAHPFVYQNGVVNLKDHPRKSCL